METELLDPQGSSSSQIFKKLKLSFLLCALTFSNSAGAQDVLEVKSLGLRVIREVPGKENEKLVPFNTFNKGTSVALLIESKGTAIIKVDTDASKITSFKDDAGNDLMTGGGRFNSDGFGGFPRIGQTGKFAMVELDASGVPNEKSGKVEVEGMISLQLASEKKKIKSAPFEIKEGVIVKLGDLEMELKKFGERSFKKEGVELNFQTSDKAVTLVAGVKFYDEAGAELKSEVGSDGRWGIGKKFTYSREYEITEKVKGKVVMEFEVWSDMKEEKVPFKIAIGVGG